MNTPNPAFQVLILSALAGMLFLSGCDRLRDRQLSRLNSTGPQQAVELPSSAQNGEVNPSRVDPMMEATGDIEGLQPADENPGTIEEANQLLSSLETELFYEQIDLAEGSLDLEFLELDALLVELESQEPTSILEDLP